MAHHIYHTRGVILGSGARGESNRFYKIFTEELGLIETTAQSVREGKSKLRYVLQDYSMIFVDLVRGKEAWRITSASEEETTNFSGSENQKKLFAKMCALNARLLQGEGQEKKLFTDLRALADFLKKGKLPRALLPTLEILVATRSLSFLGYIDGADFNSFLNAGEFSEKLVEQFVAITPKALLAVNNALASSHL